MKRMVNLQREQAVKRKVTDKNGSSMVVALKTIVVVDPTPWATSLAQQLASLGFSVRRVGSITHAMDAIDDVDDGWVITELCCGQCAVADVIQGIKQCKPQVQIVVVTRYASIELAVASIRAGARDVITKPASIGAILRAFDDTIVIPADLADSGMALKVSIGRYIADTLAEYQSVSKTARILGVDRRSLRRMITRYVAEHSLDGSQSVVRLEVDPEPEHFAPEVSSGYSIECERR
jgi:two-component system, response regulator RegA